MKLWPPFLKWKPKVEPLSDGGLEHILDIKEQNAFLRRVVFLMSLALVGLVLQAFWRPAQREQTAPPVPYSNVRYDEDGPPLDGEGASARNATEAPHQSPPTDGKAASQGGTKETRGISPKQRQAMTPSAHLSAPELHGGNDISLSSAAGQGFHHETHPESAVAARSAPRLWDLLDRIRNDPGRELLDRSFDFGEGILVVFHEAIQEGMVHFELINEGRKPLYLPGLGTGKVPSQVYLERRVLEPDTRTQGVLVMKGWGGPRSMEVCLFAANMKPVKFHLEVPQW